jgi:hypothetical protein
MKVSIVAAAAMLGLASAQNAVVKNDCSVPIYVQSFPYSGGAGTLTTVQPGKTFSEKFRSSGSTVKVAKTKTLDKPLFFGYSFSSNPFADSKNTLSAGDGCEQFSCAAKNDACYSTPAHKKVFGCPQPVTLTATICKK